MPRRYPSLKTLRAVYISPERGTFSDGSECCICLDRYDNGAHRPVGVTSNRECEHVFGRRCLEAYLDSTNTGSNTCPVCRRKWYSCRSTNLPTPRDTNTSRVLSPPTQLWTSFRDGGESRSFYRPPSQVAAQVERAVGQLVNDIEALEALERRGTTGLEQDVRVRLQQVRGRIHTFLERNATASEVSFGPVLRRRSGLMASSTRDSPANHEQDPVVAEPDDGQYPHSRTSIALQSSTVSLLELPSPGQRSSQQIDDSSAVTPPALDYRRDFAAIERPSSQLDHAIASPILMTGSQTEASSRLDGQRSVALSQPSNQSVSGQEVNLRATRNHLRSNRPDRSHNVGIQEAGPRSASHMSLPDIVEVGSRTSATQTTVTGYTHQHTRPPVQSQRHATAHAPILFPRYQMSRLRRTRSTHELTFDTQPARALPQPILESPMAEREADLRSRATVARSPRGLSRIMTISNLRNFVTGNRAR